MRIQLESASKNNVLVQLAEVEVWIVQNLTENKLFLLVKAALKMSKRVNIGTLNLWLGLQNKKDSVIDLLKAYLVDVWGLQETEIPINFPENMLNSGGFTIELENNTEKNELVFT